MRILCFGDSNTFGYDPRALSGGRYGAQSRWVDLLAQQSGWEVVNAGENGREIPSWDYELQDVLQLLSCCEPLDLLIVLLGYNDLLQGLSAEAVAARMEHFLRQVPLAHGNILLIGPPPMKRGAWVESDQLVADCVRLCTLYGSLAHELGIRFVDAGKWKIDMAFDGVHFSEQGSRFFAQKLLAALCDLLCEV